jgi:putative membrane protein
MIIPVLFWIAAFVGIGLLIKMLAASQPGGTANKSALEILSERYAKGEIDRDEYLLRKRDITGG